LDEIEQAIRAVREIQSQMAVS